MEYNFKGGNKVSEIKIQTGLLSCLPKAENFNPENGNLIYISTDEPAMYVFTATYNNGILQKHVLRLSDFPSDLWRIGEASFATNTDQVLFDTSQGENTQRRTLKKGKLPSMFTGADTVHILDTIFPNQLTVPSFTPVNSGNTITYRTSSSITIPANSTILVSLGLKEYKFCVLSSNTTFNANQVSWSYLTDFVYNESDTAQLYHIFVTRTDGASVDLTQINKFLRVAIADNSQEAFYSQVDERLSKIENKLKAFIKAPFELKTAASIAEMNADISQIYLCTVTNADDNKEAGYIYVYSASKALETPEDPWVQLCKYVDNPNDVEERLQALEELGLEEKDGQVQVNYSFENKLYPVAKSAAQYSNLDNNQITLIPNGTIAASADHNIGFTLQAPYTWAGPSIGYKWLRGTAVALWANVPPGTYLFKVANDLPPGCEIIAYKTSTITTTPIYNETAEQLQQRGAWVIVDKYGVIVKIDETTNLSLIFRIHPNTTIAESIDVIPQVYLLKGPSHSPLLLDRTGDEIVEALQNLTLSEERINNLIPMMLNPAKYLAKIGETVIGIAPNSELLVVNNNDTSEIVESHASVEKITNTVNYRLTFASQI